MILSLFASKANAILAFCECIYDVNEIAIMVKNTDLCLPIVVQV